MDKKPSLDDRSELHYINAVLHESFRVTSFVPMSVPHHVSADVKVAGYVIPKGAILLPSLYHVMHDPEYFKDPETFQPDRFLDEQDYFVADERVIPFSIGKRFCLGQSLAEKEFFLFFTGLLHAFRFEHAPGKEIPPYNVNKLPIKGILRSTPTFEVVMSERK